VQELGLDHGGTIAQHVAGQPTKHISAGETTEAIAKYSSGNGVVRIDVHAAIDAGAGYVVHSNVLEGVARELGRGATRTLPMPWKSYSRIMCLLVPVHSWRSERIEEEWPLWQIIPIHDTALSILAQKGYQLWYIDSTKTYWAERDGWDFASDSPVGLLGGL
jgi:hypothetical protein